MARLTAPLTDQEIPESIARDLEVVELSGAQTVSGVKRWADIGNFDAAVRFRKDPHIDPRHPDFGVVGDGVADDSPGMAAIVEEFAPLGSGTPPIKINLWPGAVIRLTETWEVRRIAAVILGSGVGNPSNFATNPGSGTTIQWDGPATVPMWEVRDCQHFHYQDIYFRGNTAAPPSAAIRYYNVSGDGSGTNQQLTGRRCRFGYLAWLPTGGYEMDRCIIFDGHNTNNDQFHFEDFVFARPTTECLSLPNSQSIWGLLTNCHFAGNLTAKGLVTSASVDLVNPSFDACTVDIEANATSRVHVYGYHSERSARWINQPLNQSSKVSLYGGTAQITDTLFEGERYFVKLLGVYSGGGCSINDVAVSQTGATRPKIYARGSQNTTALGEVTIRGCPAILKTDLDIAAAIGTRPLRVIAQGGDMNINRTLLSGAVLDTTVVDDDLLTLVSTDNGDAAKTLTVHKDAPIQRWATSLTADRAVTLSTTGARNGQKWRILRTPTATGAFNLNVGTGPLKALAVGQWAEVVYDGAAWILEGSGSL